MPNMTINIMKDYNKEIDMDVVRVKANKDRTLEVDGVQEKVDQYVPIMRLVVWVEDLVGMKVNVLSERVQYQGSDHIQRG